MSSNATHPNVDAELRGHETVLLVEDEPSLLDLGKRMLESLGYRVLMASHPEEAIALAEKMVSEIDLLLTDVVMPSMNGLDLATRLSQSHPELKYMFMSGYATDIISNQGLIEEGVQFLQKPFALEDLAAHVREALGASKPGSEVWGKDDTALFPQDDARRVMAGDRRVMESGETQTSEESITPDGVKRKQTETALLKMCANLQYADRMARLGEIASSLVHELNQPLTGILGNAQAAQNFLKRAVPDLEETQNILDDIVADVKRAGSVIHLIRRFLKHQTSRGYSKLAMQT